MGIFSFFSVIITAFLSVIPLTIMLALYVLNFFFEGIAFTKLAKRRPVYNLWMVWAPCLSDVIGKKFVMAEMSDTDDIRMFGSLAFKNKFTPIGIYFVVLLAHYALALILGLLSLIPVVGSLFLILYLICAFPCFAYFFKTEYIYLREILNTFKPDTPSNDLVAYLITVFSIFTCGIVRGIYLLSLAKELKKRDKDSEVIEETEEVGEEIVEEINDKETTEDIIEE